MADQASALIGIVGFGLHGCRRMCEFAEDVYDAPTSLETLIDDAYEVLQIREASGLNARAIFEPDRRTRMHAMEVIRRSNRILTETNDFVRAVSTQGPDGELVLNRAAWIRKGRCYAKLEARLQNHKVVLLAYAQASSS